MMYVKSMVVASLLGSMMLLSACSGGGGGGSSSRVAPAVNCNIGQNYNNPACLNANGWNNGVNCTLPQNINTPACLNGGGWGGAGNGPIGTYTSTPDHVDSYLSIARPDIMGAWMTSVHACGDRSFCTGGNGRIRLRYKITGDIDNSGRDGHIADVEGVIALSNTEGARFSGEMFRRGRNYRILTVDADPQMAIDIVPLPNTLNKRVTLLVHDSTTTMIPVAYGTIQNSGF